MDKAINDSLAAQPMRVALMLEWACRLRTDQAIHRYLMANAHGRWSGAEKAERHRELCSFYVAVVRGHADPERAAREHRDAYEAVHTATKALTDHLDEQIGFPLDSTPDYDALAPAFFKRFHALAMQALLAQPGVCAHPA